MEAKLKENGWFLSSEGIAECERACNKDKPSLQEMSRAALNLDLKQYGVKRLPDDINRGKVQEVTGPMILQVQRLRNISAPKANEESNHAPRLLKIQLTDGHLTCHGLENSSIPDLSLAIPPGTKISLTGTIAVKENFLMLDSNNTKVLGGEVEKLREKWELNKTLAKHSRMTVSGEGPPPFVPFGPRLQTGSDNKGRSSDNTKVNGVVQNSTEKPRGYQSKDSPLLSKARSFDNGKNSRPNHDHKDGGFKKINNNQQDSRAEDKKVTAGKMNNKFSAEEKTSLNIQREKETKLLDSESANHDRSRQGYSQTDDNRHNSRTERGERSEKPTSRTQEPNRGGGRLRGRGGRRGSGGRVRAENEDVDDVEDYRSRQPSEPALWDFLSTKFPSVKDTRSEKPLKSIENHKTDEAHQERPPPRPPPRPDNEFKQRQHKQDSRVEKSENASHPRQQQGDGQGEYATPRAVDKQKQESSAHYRDGRQQGKPQKDQHYKQQQNLGQAKGKGSRRHDHDSRPYNQSLPPRLQKKQQQQQQQRQLHQQHHQHYQHHNQHQSETEVSNDDVEVNTTVAPSVAQEDDAIITFSAASAPRQTEYVEEPQSQMPQPAQFQESQGAAYSSQQFAGPGKWQRSQHQGAEQYRQTSFTPPNVQQQQQQHLEFVSMAMESQRSQAQLVMSQTQPYVEQGGQEQAEIGLVQEYQYAQQPQAPVQAYPMYQLRPAQVPQQQMISQQTIPQQPVDTPMAATQVGWKKGDHCLALWRDGQCYSAKMEDLMPDGVNCVVSFLDFHNSCDVVPLSSLRPFPIITWGESGNAQPPPTGAVATLPYYAQPTPVSIVSRPQMVIPVSGQPPFHAGTRPTIVHSASVPPQVHWQPATMQYQEVRPAAFQPVMHYGAVPQTSGGVPGQAPYGIPAGGGVHYVRGVKDIQGQDVYSNSPEGGRGRSSPTSGSYSKPRRPNRATQSYYVPPRQQKYKDKG